MLKNSLLFAAPLALIGTALVLYNRMHRRNPLRLNMGQSARSCIRRQ